MKKMALKTGLSYLQEYHAVSSRVKTEARNKLMHKQKVPRLSHKSDVGVKVPLQPSTVRDRGEANQAGPLWL